MTTLFQIETHVRSMIDEDGAILLDLEAGKYYSLNGVAASIWSRAEKKLDRDMILDELTCETICAGAKSSLAGTCCRSSISKRSTS